MFISYTTHADADLAARERLRKILGLICHARTVRGDPWSVWVDDGRLKAGDKWKDDLIDALNEASVFVIVMSTDYMASEFCRDQELPRMLERHDEEDVRVLGVWLDDVNLDLCVAPLAGGRVMSMQDLQCLPRGPKGDGLLAVRQWDDEDDAWSKVAEEIERAWPTTDDVPSKVEPDGDGSSELKLPYWCDRYTQVKSLSRCLRQSVAPRRPLVLVHEAHEDDVPAEWVQRLALSEIDKAMLSAKGREAPGFGTPHYFGWPRDPWDADEALHELCDGLGRAVLSRAADRKALQTWQSRQPVLWWTQLLATASEASVGHSAEALGRLLTGWPHRARGAMLVVVLNVVAARAGEDTGPVKRLLVQRLAAAGGDAGGFQLADLGTLGLVTEQDVIDWLNDHRFGAQLRRLGRDPLDLRDGVLAGVRMREFVRLFDAWRGRTGG